MSLTWEKDYDDMDNTMWEAETPFEEYSTFRINPVLVGDKIQYTLSDSTEELLSNDLYEALYDTAEDAKAAAQKALDEMVQEAMKEAPHDPDRP